MALMMKPSLNILAIYEFKLGGSTIRRISYFLQEDNLTTDRRELNKLMLGLVFICKGDIFQKNIHDFEGTIFPK